MLKKLADLVDLKSIITICLVVTLVYAVVSNLEIKDEAIKTLFTTTTSSCFTYYFVKKKNNAEGE